MKKRGSEIRVNLSSVPLTASPSHSAPLFSPVLDEKIVDTLKSLQDDVPYHSYWHSRLQEAIEGAENIASIHLGIFVEPFLSFLLDGKKTVESRFSANRQAPFQMAQEDDILLVKASGGPIVGICRIAQAWFYHLDEESWADIKDYSEMLCVQDPLFWEQKAHASYASLLSIDNVISVSPVPFPKRDRRGWMLLHKSHDA